MSSVNPVAPGQSLSGKVALVTGGSRGIGRAIVLRLAALGAGVAFSYLTSPSEAKDVVRQIVGAGGAAIALQADLSSVPAIRTLVAETADWRGRLDILVNSAGNAEFAPIAEMTESAFDSLFALNVKGVFFCLQEASRILKDDGRIINISSGITISGSAGGAAYGGAKGAVEQFTLAAAKELGGRRITVNTVSPGVTDTDLLHRVIDEQTVKAIAAGSPLGRVGQPDDIAEIVAFLATDSARWITGQNIRANGGGS